MTMLSEQNQSTTSAVDDPSRQSVLMAQEVVFTSHALRRCSEMGVTSSMVREIISTADRVWPGHKTSKGTDTLMRVSNIYPHYTVCTTYENDSLVVVSVLFNSNEPYLRDGRGYILISTGERVSCNDDDQSARMPQKALEALRAVAEASRRRRIVVGTDHVTDITSAAAALRAKADELDELAGLGYRLAGGSGQLVMDVRT